MPHAAQKDSRFGMAQIFQGLGKSVLTPALRVAFERFLK